MSEFEQFKQIYSPEELIFAIRVVAKFVGLFFACSIGTFTKGAIHPEENTPKQSLGFSVLAAAIVFYLSLIFDTSSVFIFGLLTSILIGFFLPSFKNILKGVRVFRVLVKAFSHASTVKDNIIKGIDEELEKEIKKDSSVLMVFPGDMMI